MSVRDGGLRLRLNPPYELRASRARSASGSAGTKCIERGFESAFQQNRRRLREAMTKNPGQTNACAAIQYLIWAIELIEKEGDAEAAGHVRAALNRLMAVKRGPATCGAAC